MQKRHNKTIYYVALSAALIASLACGIPDLPDEESIPDMDAADADMGPTGGRCEYVERCEPRRTGPELDPSLPRLELELVDPALVAVDSCEELAAWEIKRYVERWLPSYHATEHPRCYTEQIGDCSSPPYERFDQGGWSVDMSAPPPDPGTEPPVDGPDDYSGTNVQERGVDEADIIKSDGSYIYKVEGATLKVIASWPPEQAAVIASLPLPASDRSLLLREGERLIVATNTPDGKAQLQRYDISDPANPVAEQELRLPAPVSHLRMIKGRVHMIMRQPWNIYAPSDLWRHALPQSPQYDDQRAFIAQSRHRIHAALPTLARGWRDVTRAALPSATVLTGLQSSTHALYAEGCGSVRVQATLPGEAELVSLISLDPADLATASATGAVMAPELLYTSPTSLYITDHAERVYYTRKYEYFHDTVIYKFLLDRDGAPSLQGTMVANGRLLPDLSMGEHAGNLRVFTNVSNKTTELAIFGEDASGVIQKIGGITGIAPDEKATAARMVGDRLYVLTAKGSGITSPALPPEHPEFERPCDPLFVIDAADPTQPKILGDLDFPGFSAYVHPIGPDHLLSLGRDEELRLRLQVFDVSNTARPVIDHEYTVDHPDHIHLSEAQDDRLRFVYHGVRKLLAIPVTEQSLATRNTTFRGQLLFRAGLDGITPLGGVQHSALNGATCDVTRCDAPPISASMFIEHYLYSFSNAGFMIHATEAEQATALRAVSY